MTRLRRFDQNHSGDGNVGYMWLVQIPADLEEATTIHGEKVFDPLAGAELLLKLPRDNLRKGSIWVAVVDSDGNRSNFMRVTTYRRER